MLETEVSAEMWENKFRWPLNVETESVDLVVDKIQQLAENHDWSQARAALDCAISAHTDQYRKQRSNGVTGKPYITHPLALATRALSLDLLDEELLASLLLHDVVEDTPLTLADLPVNDHIRQTVDLVSFAVRDGETKQQAKVRYFQRIVTSNDAVMVKLIDRSHNLSEMANCFTCEKKIEYIRETQKYILPLNQDRVWKDVLWSRAAQTVCEWINAEIAKNLAEIKALEN